MSEFEIVREVKGSKGRYAVRRSGVVADLTYSITSPQIVIADHTAVPAELRGQGIGRILLSKMVEDARAEGFRIVPLCPFVDAQRSRHPEWADAFNV